VVHFDRPLTENKAQALADEDFAAIRDWIETTA
jgi:hypothetical protein